MNKLHERRDAVNLDITPLFLFVLWIWWLRNHFEIRTWQDWKM